MSNTTHVAGIVPIISKRREFKFPWHDCLIPVAPNFHAIELAVLECAYAGCDTIWVVINDDVVPLVRHRLGDYIQDPVWLQRKTRYPSGQRRRIPIFYAPIPEDHRNKENTISWSILWGSKTAYAVGNSISKWVSPKKFYVAFPHGVYPPNQLRPHRANIKNADNFSLFYNNENWRNGHLLGFTFGDEQMKFLLEEFQRSESNIILGNKLANQKKHYEEKFKLDKFFQSGIMGIEERGDLPWYYQINDWDGYCEYLGSEHRREIEHPGELVMSYHEWYPIGVDSEGI
jgi:hypothetical protein